MTIIVQKFGGTSLGSLKRIQHSADLIIMTRQKGYQVVVVVSAMSGETDRLMDMANSLQIEPDPREYAVLVSTGELVAMSLLSMALIEKNCPARSYSGAQARIRTDTNHKKARILAVDTIPIRQDLEQGKIVIVAGFQGTDFRGDITTLGRGGSDTSAVALAATLKAKECQIYTDVEGVYTADPRIVPEARRLERVTFEEMLEMASLGAKVLQIRSVEFAGKYDVPVRVLSSFKEGPGTLISYEEKGVESPVVSGVTYNRDEAKITVLDLPDIPGSASNILEPISQAGIEVDMIVQIAADKGNVDFTFTVHKEDYQRTLNILAHDIKELNVTRVIGDNKVAKISLVGVGMRSHAGIAATMFKTLAKEGINIQLVTTSEIKISVLIDEKYLELSVRALHSAFNLEELPHEKLNPDIP